LIIHGKLLNDEQAARYQALWDEWMAAAEKVSTGKNKPAKEYRLDGGSNDIKEIEKKYIPLLTALLNAAPDAPAEAVADG
jgi:aromatic ring-opening dioxygenase catalytic subunit (LigB family)